MSFEDDPRITVGSDPIPGGEPAGTSVRYEPIFDELEAMIGKMETEGPNAVPWDKVAKTSVEILRDHSKDILVAAYATVALYREEGFPGLAIGLKITRDMVDGYWDNLTPPKKRERARVSAVEWIAERLGPMVEDAEMAPADAPALVAAYKTLTELDDLLGTKLEGQSVALGTLTRPLRELNHSAEAAVAEAAAAAEAQAASGTDAGDDAAAADAGTAPATMPDAAAQPAAAPAPASTATPPSAASVSFDSADLDKSISDMQHSLRGFADALRAGNPADPRAYWLLRTAAWLPITRPPPVEDGKTALPEMDNDTVVSIENQLKAGDLRAALEAAEGNVANAPYWLAAHRFSAAALAQHGDDYADARQVVIGQLAAFLRRFPEIPNLRFSSGAPFADEATAAWIQDEVLAGGGAGGGVDEAAWEAGLSSARQAASKGKINDAYGIFTSGRQSAPNSRARFLWDLRQAEFCYETGDIVPAVRLLETLDDEYNERGLAEWDPDIGLQMAELLLKCYAKAGNTLGVEDGSESVRVARLQAIVCRLDMSKALSLMKPQ